MSRAKANPVVKAEEMSSDENKQMDELRKSDEAEGEAQSGTETVIDNKEVENKTEGDGKTEQKNTMVPHAALEEERQRRKAAEKKAVEAEQNQARLDERMKLINEALEKKANPVIATEIPDPDKDALGAVKMTMEEVKQLKQFRENFERNQETANQVNMVTNRAMALEKEFMTITPDYNDASNYLIASRRGELSAFGMTDQQIQQQIAQESLQIAITAMQQGKNPSEIIYNVAKLRGYQKKDGDQNNAGQSEADKIARLEAAQKSNRSLGDINGGAPNNSKIDAKTLASMPEKDFAKIMKSLSEADLHNIMGA